MSPPAQTPERPASQAGGQAVRSIEGAPAGWRQFGLEEKRLLLEKLMRARDAQAGAGATGAAQEPASPPASGGSPRGAIDFSLLFFSSNERDDSHEKYDLLLQASQLADRLGFKAVWVPERHFHPVGGLFPNPSVVAAALAVLTSQVRLRAGSVVAPLHQPLRIAEEWSVVDNLSHGRVDLSFARGWNPNDFVLSPAGYSSDNGLMRSQMETVRRLWKGGAVRLPNPLGEMAEVRIFPRPIQTELACWMTCMGGPERFKEAAASGANILTMLFNQTVEDLRGKVGVYRAARDPASGPGVITLMLHSFVHPDLEFVRRTVREPFMDFIKSTIDLHQHGHKVRGIELDEDERRRTAEFAYERYFRTGALFGTPEGCAPFVEKLIAAGIDEIACQIDFGVERRHALESIHHLAALKNLFGSRQPQRAATSRG
jgi:natural product biosynthesis luciferase-like monooxygenase protein